MSEQGNEFDLNDPNLVLDLPEDYDPEGELVGGIPQPPADGVNKVALVLAEDTENKEAVRFSKGKIVATFRVRAVKEDGELGAYLKDYYPTSQVFNGQKTSALANLCKLAGDPVRATHPKDYIAHIRGLFSPEKPFVCSAKTQWVKSVPEVVVGEDGSLSQAIDLATGFKSYVETKGQAKIAAQAIHAAQYKAQEEGLDQEGTDALVLYAQQHPHVYLDPLSGEERSVRAEVRFIVGV